MSAYGIHASYSLYSLSFVCTSYHTTKTNAHKLAFLAVPTLRRPQSCSHASAPRRRPSPPRDWHLVAWRKRRISGRWEMGSPRLSPPTPLLAVVDLWTRFHRSCRLAKKNPLAMLAAHEVPLRGLGLSLVLLGSPWSCVVAGVLARFVLGHSLLLAHLLDCWSCRWMILHVPTPSRSLPFLLGPCRLLFSLLHLPTTSSAPYLPSPLRATCPS